jgi:hypothetical protein
MGKKILNEEEFEVEGNEVIHQPTSATWTAYPDRREPHLDRQSMLGRVLPNGDNYREHAAEIALRLLRERLE